MNGTCEKENESEEQCLRAMKCELNVLSRSDGSAMFTQGSINLLYGLNMTIQMHAFVANFVSFYRQNVK
jgi:ribonuclease PH